MNKHLIEDCHRCGFYGLIGCTLSLQKRSGYGDSKIFGAQSYCQYHHRFSMKVSDKVPKAYPCSNRPVKCEYCDEIYWSYHMEAHHLSKHKGMIFNSLYITLIIFLGWEKIVYT